MTTIAYTGTLKVVTCWCGIAHAIPEELYGFVERQHRDGRPQKNIYCPLGHTWAFAGEGEAARLQRELTDSRRRHAATRDLLDAEERSHSATKGHLTRTKRRIAKGVCPCCHRSFVNVARHMNAKHPEYGTEAAPS